MRKPCKNEFVCRKEKQGKPHCFFRALLSESINGKIKMTVSKQKQLKKYNRQPEQKMFGLFFVILFSPIPRNSEKFALKRATITHLRKIFIFLGCFREKTEQNLILTDSFSSDFDGDFCSPLFTNTPKQRKKLNTKLSTIWYNKRATITHLRKNFIFYGG